MNNCDLHTICRLCLCKSFKYYSIFSDESNKLQIKTILTTLFPFEIQEDNPVIQTICLSCYHVINNFYNYYKEVLANQAFFNELLEEIQLKKINKEFLDVLHQDDVEIKSTTILTSSEFTASILEPTLTSETSQLLSPQPSTPPTTTTPPPPKTTTTPPPPTTTDIIVKYKDYELIVSSNCNDNNKNSEDIKNNNENTNIALLSSTELNEIDSDSNNIIVNETNKKNVALIQSTKKRRKKILSKESLLLKKRNNKSQTKLSSQSVKKLHHNIIDVQLPVHLRTRISKAKGDSQIKEFVRLICNICTDKTEFDTFKQLQEHYDKNHNCKGYVICCDKKIFRKDRLMNHIINHINPDAFKCPHCGQKSKSKILLRIHMKQHLPNHDRPFQCDKCDQRFVLKSQLTNHEASHFTQDQKRFVCEICAKAFALKFVLIKHKLTHTKEKNFICEICAKSFTCHSNLQGHMNQHSDPSPRVQCNYCGYWYKNIDTLRTHIRRHRDKRHHICSICKKECSTSSSLAAHIRYVHKKIKDFECNICHKEFRKKLELTEHMARHTGRILYRCPFCPKTFSSSSNYFSHRKNKHPVEFANLTIAQQQQQQSQNNEENVEINLDHSETDI